MKLPGSSLRPLLKMRDQDHRRYSLSALFLQRQLHSLLSRNQTVHISGISGPSHFSRVGKTYPSQVRNGHTHSDDNVILHSHFSQREQTEDRMEHFSPMWHAVRRKITSSERSTT